MKNNNRLFLIIPIVVLMLVGPVLANKTSVKIEAPAEAVKGSTITVKINVSHDGNSYFHYTEWVYVKVNGKEVARWDFTRNARPENENFTREVQVKVDGPLEIESQGNCNIHGSAGIAKASVAVK
jgi:desulfoferrodoxin (superoxide reductase-like protein)